MFKKIPYGVKVRVRGNEQDGFIAECAINCSRFFSFADDWNPIRHYTYEPIKLHDTFPTFELAKEAAMIQYNIWFDFYKKIENVKSQHKSQRKVVWKQP